MEAEEKKEVLIWSDLNKYPDISPPKTENENQLKLFF